MLAEYGILTPKRRNVSKPMAIEQKEMFPLPNPCINVCEAGPRGYCIGCLRSREERFNWHQKPDSEKSAILKRLALRQRRKQAFLQQLVSEEQIELGFTSQLDLPGL